MAGSVNKVILVGNLGKDPEIRRTQDGRPIAHFNLATSDTWRDKTTGESVQYAPPSIAKSISCASSFPSLVTAVL